MQRLRVQIVWFYTASNVDRKTIHSVFFLNYFVGRLKILQRVTLITSVMSGDRL